MKLGPITYTFHRNFDNCPRKAWHINIAKDLPREDHEPSCGTRSGGECTCKLKSLFWGSAVHSALEARLSKGTPLPESMSKYEEFCSFGNHMVKAELKLGMRENGKPCGFFDDDVHMRGVIDVLIPAWGGLDRAVIWDWKTGKKREDAGELEMHAVLLNANRHEFTRIMGYYVWLQDMSLGAPHDCSDVQATLERERKTREQIEHAFKHGAEAFPPRQNPLCGWCPVKSCEFNKRVP